MTGANMWAAIGAHAALTSQGLDPWRARLVADVVWRATPELRRVPPASPDHPTQVCADALALAGVWARSVTEATSLPCAVRAVGVTDDGMAWATFHGGRGLSVRTVTLNVSDDGTTLAGLADWIREA